MSCEFCRYTDQDEVETHLNENIYSDDDIMVCFMYDGGLSVWLNHDGVLCCSKYVPVKYCPMCGRRLDGNDGTCPSAPGMTSEATATDKPTCHVESFDDGVDEGMDGEWYSYAPPTWYLSCGHRAEGIDCPDYCPTCGARVVEEVVNE